MKKINRRLISALLTLITATGLLFPTASAAAAGKPPTEIDPPGNFAATDYRGASVVCTLSAPEDLRQLIGQTTQERGFSMKTLAQVDFKTDGGSWHYSSDWDNLATYTKYTMNFYNVLNGGDNGKFLGAERLDFKTMFPDEKNVPVPAAFNSWDWYKKHSITLRTRFAIDFGNKNVVFSDWSREYVLSGSSKMDYKKIMAENAPTILSSKIEARGVNKVPWVVLQLAQHPDTIQMLNAAAGNAMWTEIWLRKSGDQDFKNAGSAPFANENISLDISAYFKNSKVESYDAQAYEVKVRYKIDERAYQQSGASAMNWLYSPFSNLLSYGMPAWSKASAWAAPELKKADEYGLVPEVLKGADLTKPITREEFASLAVVLYEKTTGDTAVAASPNPFTDTQNPEVLKAFKLGITKGTSAVTFAPKELINREQVAAMLSRAIRTMVPDGDFSTDGAPEFSDQKDISAWALEDVKFMSKIGVIKGTDGKFMPKATTTAQKAAGYATNTREQAIAMGVRIYEKYKH